MMLVDRDALCAAVDDTWRSPLSIFRKLRENRPPPEQLHGCLRELAVAGLIEMQARDTTVPRFRRHKSGEHLKIEFFRRLQPNNE